MYRRLSLGLIAWCFWLVNACGGNSSNPAAGGGCTNDEQCKGDRVCENGTCVDPHGSQPQGGSTSNAAGATATAGAGGSTAGNTAYSGKPPQGGANAVIDDPELERACSLDCEARIGAACSMNVGSLDQCLAQCLVIDESSQGYCLDEMTDRYACSASGGYTCVSGYAQPKSTCIAEATALSKCSQMTPCRMYCDRLPSDCTGSGANCLTTCMQQQNQFADAICNVYYTQLLSCWSRAGVTCENGNPMVGTCGAAVAEVADCIARRNHECDGYCWAAKTLGCGSDDCVTTCKGKADASRCGSYYRNLIDCAISNSRDLELSCEAGEPKVDMTACMTYQQQYDSCMMMP